jgi:hypothetical protein
MKSIFCFLFYHFSCPVSLFFSRVFVPFELFFFCFQLPEDPAFEAGSVRSLRAMDLLFLSVTDYEDYAKQKPLVILQANNNPDSPPD